jgi:hypothetical protein
MLSPDLRRPLDIREVIGRVVDGSRFEDWKPRYGATLVCGWASIQGYPIGILGNNGVLTAESAEKGAHFIQLCNQIDVPLLFLQNLTGFVVGRDPERAGIIKKGSQLINAVTNSTVPHLTVIIGASYGAGTYAMSGRAFNNRFTFIWPSAKIAVMGGKQIAGVMSIVRRGQAARKGESFDEAMDAKIVAAVEAVQERDRSRSRRRARSATTASWIRAIRARCSGSASRRCATSRSREPAATGCSGCELHDPAGGQSGRDRPAHLPQRARDGHPLHRGVRRRGCGCPARRGGRRSGAARGQLPRRQGHPGGRAGHGRGAIHPLHGFRPRTPVSRQTSSRRASPGKLAGGHQRWAQARRESAGREVGADAPGPRIPPTRRPWATRCWSRRPRAAAARACAS